LNDVWANLVLVFLVPSLLFNLQPAKIMNEKTRNRNKPEEVFEFDKRYKTGLSGGLWAQCSVFSKCG
jgi:hypothetical protein